ncbi:MAG: hypothetical protein A2V93_10985 [Ignavibacteria bacterium RBG_16_34_14]|nr:MAG: hypothetical protein A2V93_10985 [Ignavibacteria bacterium RBG_16_34_14]
MLIFFLILDSISSEIKRRKIEAAISTTEIEVDISERMKEIFAREISLKDSLIINNKLSLYKITEVHKSHTEFTCLPAKGVSAS